MPDVIHDLYEKQAYPPMSHPLSDPAVSAVAARLGGLEVPHPRRARILEIGCCSGHNLIPLAMRWPESEFVGIDLAETSIREAGDRAAAAGVENVVFHAADLRDYQPDGRPFDFIVAHGFFSWVPDEVKASLLAFCRKHLSPSGIATLSFNLECGWKPRWPVIEKVRAIQQATGVDTITGLEMFKSIVVADGPEIAIINDMLAKGPSILAFDDFAPVNDPWPLDRFAQAAAKAGLRWLGESDPGENFPTCLSEESIRRLQCQTNNPLEFQLVMDEAASRTFRSGLLCRDDAVVADQIPLEGVWDFSLRVAKKPLDPLAMEIHRIFESFAPACVPAEVVKAALPDIDIRMLARKISDGIAHGWIRPRIEPMSYEPAPQEFPKLDAFRMLCAQQGLPLVDAWHASCAFPVAHYFILSAMSGSRSQAELAEFSKIHCPELAFEPWLRHLARRGMFT